MNSSILKEETKEIYLRKARVIDERFSLDGVASVGYDIIFDGLKVGYIDLRRTMNEYMYYYGHVGYHVYEPYRGQHFALKACLKLAKIAKVEYGFQRLIITTCPDNQPSIKTIKHLNTRLIEVVDVPKSHPLYLNNEKVKMIYEWIL